jgi:hypothetical protein
MNIFTWLRSLGEKGEVAVSTPAPAGAPPASASAPVTLPPAGDGEPPATPPAFAIPDAYKDRPYVKGIDSADKLWAMLDGAETKLGQRPAGIPADTATPEEWRKFWTAMGAPETADKYAFDYGKNADGTVKTAPDPKWESGVKEMLYKYGISAKNAVGLQKDFDALAQNMLKEKGLAEQALNQEFDKIGKDIYGAEYDKAVARVSPLLKEFTNPKLQPGLAKLNPEALAILTNVVDNIRAKFISADTPPGTPPGGGPTGNADSLRAEARALMATPAYSNSFDPSHDATKIKIAELYQRASQMK